MVPQHTNYHTGSEQKVENTHIVLVTMSVLKQAELPSLPRPRPHSASPWSSPEKVLEHLQISLLLPNE
jgi:hypothetical protein